nr:hypothetical protein [uncultured Rhodoferax sp.]
MTITNAPVVQRELLARSVDGDEWPLNVRVWAPTPSELAPWSCLVEVDRLFSPAKPIYGEDSWQAMQLALEFVGTMLQHFQLQGGILFRSDGDLSSGLRPLQALELLPRLRP